MRARIGTVALVIAADVPSPPQGGNHLRYLQTMAILRSVGFHVHLVAGAVRPDAASASAGPDATLVGTVDVPAPGTHPADQARRIGAIIRGSLRRPPIDPWGLAHVQAGFDDLVVESVKKRAPDVVVIRSLFAHLLPRLRAPGRVLVVDAHDVGSLQADGMMTASVGLRSAGLRLRRTAATRAERALSHADEIWAVSPSEVEHFRGRAGRIVLVRNGVEVPESVPPRNPQATSLVLAGSYGYPPNLTAATRLVNEVLPIVRRSRPEVTVTLIGRDLPPDVARAWSDAGVRYLGLVDDPAAHTQHAAALVFLPSWSTGTPLKVAEALANGVPVICNETAAQGLGLSHGVNALIGRSGVEHAAHVLEVLDNPGRAEGLRKAGHAFARDHLSRSAVKAEIRRSSIITARS